MKIHNKMIQTLSKKKRRVKKNASLGDNLLSKQQQEQEAKSKFSICMKYRGKGSIKAE